MYFLIFRFEYWRNGCFWWTTGIFAIENSCKFYYYWCVWTWRNVSFFVPPVWFQSIKGKSKVCMVENKKTWTFTGDKGTGEWSSYLQGYVRNSHRIFIPGMRKHNNNYYFYHDNLSSYIVFFHFRLLTVLMHRRQFNLKMVNILRGIFNISI